MAFYSEQDYARGTASYSDVDSLADITHYGVAVDLTRPDERLAFTARIDLTPSAGVRALPFIIGEGLSTFQDQRLEAQLHVKGARLDGAPLAWSQEDWESGFTVYPSVSLEAGRPATIEVDVEGRFLQSSEVVRGAYYPISNQAWLPRHGDLDRATFDLTFTHRVWDRVASIGARTAEAPDPAAPDRVVTTYHMPDPVALAVFAVGPFERHRQEVTFEAGGRTIPLEFNKLPDSRGPIAAVKEDFVLAELDNSIRYFAAIFGPYPYGTFGAAFHPYPFGQGFPTLMMLAPADRAATSTFAFISHETAHQWWGNIVAWRSYRDQWLSEGFAEYSGVLYTGLREKQEAAAELVRDMRRALVQPPRTLQGFGRGRLNDIGPIILGRRLNSSETFGAYQALVYSKGGLVLRMLHFLLSDPAADPIASNDGAFNRMMTAFAERYRNSAASTDNFRTVAGEHFRSTTIALRLGLPHLNWFFRQWVYQTGLPSYRFEYELAEQAGGGTLVTGTLFQDNVPADWIMPLPLVFTFDGDRAGRSLVIARGPSSPVEVRLPERPITVELDPEAWVLSERTETTRR
jgi:aminopeptidase N